METISAICKYKSYIDNSTSQVSEMLNVEATDHFQEDYIKIDKDTYY